MENAVIYARYSSHGQNEQTIDGQIRVCTEYAEKMGLNIIKTYIDKHKTGTDVNRPQFQQMIEDSKIGAFQYVIVYMLDRFARNRYYSTIYSFQLSQNGVQILSAMENISESEEGDFYRLFLEWNAEQYSKRLSKRVRDGIDTSVKNGNYTGGNLIFGYRKQDKKVIIDEEQSKIVQKIFKMYANGYSKKEITEKLNKEKFTYKGKPFSPKYFEKMLKNPKYTGSFILGGRQCDNMYPKIISKELYNKVQTRLKLNKHKSGANSAKEPYLLQGKLYCGYCGDKMIAGGGNNPYGIKYRYYSCKKRKQHKCIKRNEDKGFVEWYITEQTVNFLSNTHNLKNIARNVIEYYNFRTSTKEIERVNKQISEVSKHMNNILNYIALIDSNIETNQPLIQINSNKLQELSKQITDLENYKSQLEFEKKLNLDEKHIFAFVNKYIKGNLVDKGFQKRIIDNLVNCVYLYDDKVVIYFNIGGTEESYIGLDETQRECNSVQTSPTLAEQTSKSLNKDKVYYIFVNGIAGIIVFREDNK